MRATKKLAYLILFNFLIATVCLSQENLNLEMFTIGKQVSTYPSFKIADSIPEWTEFKSKKFRYYLHNDAGSFLFLNRVVNFIVATTNLQDEIVSVSIVTKFDEELLDDLQKKYGQWDTASLGSNSERIDTLDVSKFSYYLWRKKNELVSLTINRYATQLDKGIISNDYAVISKKSKEYWDSK